MGQPAQAKPEFDDHDEIVAELTNLLVTRQAIMFGKYKLKSGKPSPYILRTDRLSSGQDAFTVGRSMALTVRYYFGPSVEYLFGTAYKGIPVSVLAAQYYALLCGTDTKWAFNRREPKQHAEGGVIVGGIGDGSKAVIVDDALTDGVDIREAISGLKMMGVQVLGVVVMVDRLERSRNKLIGLEIERDTGVPIKCCANIAEIMQKISPESLPEDQRKVLARHLSSSG